MEITVIYPHQLFEKHPAVKRGRRVYLVEEPLLLTHNPIHKQKLIFHKLSMDAYEEGLKEAGHEVTRLSIHDFSTTKSVFKKFVRDGVAKIHIADTTDDYLEQAISKSGLERVWYESPLFILGKEEAVSRYKASNQSMARFYKAIRRDKNILMDNKEPIGSKWSFDEENRRKLPKKISLPEDIKFIQNSEITKAVEWADGISTEKYGEAGCWLPYTSAEAQKFLKEFLRLRFPDFGPFEDAIDTTHTRLFHSTLSPLLNIGLLTPNEVIEKTLAYAKENEIPINSLEGFIRQIIGWREFIRASYEAESRKMRQGNFFNNKRPLPQGLWDATTNLLPLDKSVERSLKFGYTHHIERLMVVGNYLLLTETNPHEVYRWFMAMYVDAYDWVMVPNVYGMSQFADGGSFATKPYVSGASYIKKMSNYPKGGWEDVWTALYWNFIDKHQNVFLKNHRLSMMPRLLEKMSKEKREYHLNLANKHFNSVK